MPSTIKTIWTGVVFVAGAALTGAGGGSLPGAALTVTSSVPAEVSKGSGAVDRSFNSIMAMFALFGGLRRSVASMERERRYL